MTEIRKTEAECYIVRDGHEWAYIFVKHGKSLVGDRYATWVRLAIHSSYGEYAYYWGHCGDRPWQNFLSECDIGYAMQKLASGRQLHYDLYATAKAMRENILERRREEGLTKDQARLAWRALEDAESSHDISEFASYISATDAFCDDYYDYFRKVLTPAAKAFWDRLWTPWVNSLPKVEVAA